MEIIIDNREKDLITLFEKNDENCIKQNLDIGDIHFVVNNEIIYIIERKTYQDLGASIKDGRYKEQKIRLLANNKNNIFYIIEGNINEATNLSYKSLHGSIINMIFRDNIKIIHSQDITETYNILIQIKNKFMNGKFKKINCDTEDYISSIKINKKENIDKKTCNIIQLACIPGISKKTASLVIDEYKTITNIILIFKNSNNEALKDFKIGKKKLGKVLSGRLYDYLL